MYCQVCKIDYPEGKKFCRECGSTLVEKEATCPKCQTPLTLKPDEKFCIECGAPLTPTIPGLIKPKRPSSVKWLTIAFICILVGLAVSIILYHYYNFKIPLLEGSFQFIESKIWKVSPDTLARAKTIKDSVNIFPIDGPLYEESGKLFYWESRQPAIPLGGLKKGEIVDIIAIGKRRSEEKSRMSVKIRSSSGVIGYVGVPGDIEITRIYNDKAAFLLLPSKLSYEWEGDPAGPIYDAKVYEEFIRSFPNSKYIPKAKLIVGLNYWAASGLYENPIQPVLEKDLKKADFYRNRAESMLKDVLSQSTDHKFSAVAGRYLKKIERGEKHPYITQDEKELNSYWTLMKKLKGD